MEKLSTANLDKYFFVHIGCPVVKDQELNHLFQLGYNVLIIDDVGIKPKSKIYHTYHHLNFTNISNVVELIKSFSKQSGLILGHIFTLADGSVDITNHLLIKFNLSPIYKRELASIRNKYLMRKRLEILGHSIPICDLVEYKSNPKKYNPSDFPLIVKPVDSMSSRSVRFVKNNEELIQACKFVGSEETRIKTDNNEISVEEIYSLKKQALIESYIDGTEFSVEVILFEGQVLLSTITEKITSGAPYFVEKGHISGAHEYQIKLKSKVDRLINSLIQANDYFTTLLHIEFKLTKTEEIFLIECNSRLAGDQISALTEKSIGIHLLIEFLNIVINNSAIKYSLNYTKVALRYFISTDKQGFIYEQSEKINNKQINWWYDVSEKITLLGSERMSRLGSVDADFDDIQSYKIFLQQLTSAELNLYKISKEQTQNSNNSIGSISDLVHLKLKSLYFFSVISIAIILSIGVGILLWKNQTNYINLFGKSMSSAIIEQVAFKEVLPLSQRIAKAHSFDWCSRIVVIDKNKYVIYSTTEEGLPGAQIFRTVNINDFEFNYPVVSNGLTEGYILIDRNYNRILISITLVSLAIFSLLSIVYLITIKILLPKSFLSIKFGIEQLEKTLDCLAIELNGMSDSKYNKSIILESYRKELDSLPSSFSELSTLKKITDKILSALSKVQLQISDKDRLKELYSESTKRIEVLKNKKENDSEYNNLVGDLMAQVAHDIRSPISALDMLSKSTENLPEDKRILLRTAIKRINDITQGLTLKKAEAQAYNQELSASVNSVSKLTSKIESLTIELMPSLINAVVSEKRLQFMNRSGDVDIDFSVDELNYGLFAKVQIIEFKRVLSNILNNAIEATESSCKVKINLNLKNDLINLKITDNGKGIPSEILNKLCKKGNTFGKVGGSGLGLYHATTRIKEWGGDLQITSQVGLGTTIIITLPNQISPIWFLKQIEITNNSAIIVLDDDQSIHQIWSERFKNNGFIDNTELSDKISSNNSIFHFSNSIDFCNNNDVQNLKNSLYLFDYELIGQKETGLDVIERMRIDGTKCILVTSHYEEAHIKMRCERLGVRLLPKSLAPYVRIGMI